jgi:prolyl oligopeptidase
LLPLNQQGGIQTENELADSLRFATVKDYEDWIARLRAFPTYMDQTIALMREGIKVGMAHPKVIMERVPAQVAAQIVGDPADSLFFKPFQRLPDEISQGDRDRLIQQAKQAIAEQIIPSFRRFHTFFMNAYLPACPDRVGVWQMPRGKEMYAFRARQFTTTNLTPEEIHQIGQREVKRIRAEMEKIIEQVKFKGTFEEFLHFLRTDPQFYYKDSQELLAAYRALAKRIDPTLVKLFGKLPRMPYGVEPIPDNIAPDTTTAYYRQPAADGSRAGTYFVNLYKPETRPKYEMEALSIHEAVPGHHLQIALAMELGELPAFRRFGGYTAFVEGWGLYSEGLGEELGFYKDPHSKFGQLTYEMWRAVRLVVDTGMHYFGWSRQQAIDFFKANAAKTELDIINEIDRYIGWPGQALAYKIGELKIKELRARASRELGDRFDFRAFHDVVLGSGAVPLDVLEANINAWIAKVKSQ